MAKARVSAGLVTFWLFGLHQNVTYFLYASWHRERVQVPEHTSQSHSSIEHAVTMGLRGFAATTAAISLIPFIFGISGAGAQALEISQSLCSTGAASGLAGMAADAATHVPLIGAYLATGGIVNGVLALGIGLGGIALSRHLEKTGHPTASKIVRWGSVATSILVSLPALLPAVGMGFHFISIISEGAISDWALKAFDVLGKLGAAGAASSYASSGSAVLASAGHLLACGLAAGSTAVVAESAARSLKPKPVVASSMYMNRIQPESAVQVT